MTLCISLLLLFSVWHANLLLILGLIYTIVVVVVCIHSVLCIVLCAVFRLIVVLFCVMCVVCCVLLYYHCHRVKTRLQLK
jgi:hypothetical protein